MADLKRTGLYDLHLELDAKMVPFAGYEMPVQYPLGVMKEHLHCRGAAGLFDVSHMGQVILRPRSGVVADAARAFETLVPVDVLGLAEGRQRYAFFTNDTGGIEDDLMVANRGDHLFVVVNAACKAADLARMQAGLGDICEVIEVTDRALLALQGPQAETALARIAPEVTAMRFMDVAVIPVAGGEIWVSRSGYTGEDGFEISVAREEAEALAEALAAAGAQPAGLAARDTLRLEAGLPLHGSDIDAATSPVEAGLTFAIQKARRAGGDREGGFPGAGRILSQLADGPARLRAGIRPEGRAPFRAHVPLFDAENAEAPAAEISSGTFGATAGGPVAMACLPAALAAPGTPLWGEVRGKRLPAAVHPLPFVPHRYKR